MKFLLIALACLTVASASMLGQKKCTWGPSYWCQHIGTAKECGAVEHCITVWKNNRQPSVTSTESCLICKGLIKDLKAIVASKSSQDEIKDFALKACALLHNEKTAQEVCDTVMVMFLPEIIKMIESELDESKICNVVGLCSIKIEAKFELAPVVKHVVNNLKSPECNECKLGVTFVKSFLSEKSTQQEIIKFLNQEICRHLPGELRTLCKTEIADNLPKVFAELEKLLDPAFVCSLIGMCPKKIGAKNLIRELIVKLAPRKYKANAIECDLCEAGVTDIRVFLREKGTQTDVINFLKSHVCPHLGFLAVTCTQVVDQYIPVAFQMLVSELDPTTICRDLGLCTKTIKVAKVKPVTPMNYPKAGEKCIICESIIREVNALIGSNRSVQAIEAALHKVCSVLPSTMKSKCDRFVHKYTQIIVKLLTKYVSPSRVCTAIGLCPGEKEPQIMNHRQMFETCDLMMRNLRVLIKETRLPMEQVHNIVCNFLPKKDRMTCTQAVDQYIPEAFQILVSELDPTTICRDLGLRTKTIKVAKVKPVTPMNYPKAGEKCIICESIIREVNALIGSNRSVQAIEAALHKVCSVLPSTMKSKCDRFVHKYTQIIVKLLTKYVSPSRVCTAIGLCPGEKEPVTPMNYPKGGPRCIICKFVIREIDRLIGSNRSVAAIKAALHKVCSILPSPIKPRCDRFVERFASVLVKLLTKYVKPARVCAAIGFCAGEKEPQIMNHRQMFKTCDLMMRNLRVLIKETKLPMEQAQNVVCNFLPRKDRMTCRTVKAKFSAKVHKLGKAGIIHQSFKPRDFCKSHRVLPKPDGLVHLLGRTKCTRGPSFWCANYSNAAMCGAINHCMNHYWKTKGLL